MLHASAARFDVMENLKKKLVFGWQGLTWSNARARYYFPEKQMTAPWAPPDFYIGHIAETEPQDKHRHHLLPDPHMRASHRAPERHQQRARQAQVQMRLCLPRDQFGWKVCKERVWHPVLNAGSGGELSDPQPATVASHDSDPPCWFQGCKDILPTVQWFAWSILPWLLVLPCNCACHWEGQSSCRRYVLVIVHMLWNAYTLVTMFVIPWVNVVQFSAISGGLFPVLSPSLNATDLLDLFTKIVAVSSLSHQPSNLPVNLLLHVLVYVVIVGFILS